MRHKLFILHNPNAGPTARRHYHLIVNLLRNAGAQAELVETSRHGEGMRVTAEAARSGGFDAIVAAGGDGTVHDAAEGLLGSDTPLGVIPMGTANVFAREAGLPLSPERVAHTLLYGTVRAIPVGQINDRPFLFVVGIGFDAEAVAHFEASGTRQLGQLGLIGPVLRALLSHRDVALRVTTDGGRKEAQWVIVTRVQRYAGGLLLSRNADIAQTKFYVVRFGGRGKLVRLRQLVALACGLVSYDRDVTIEEVEWVRVESDKPLPIQIDGEILGALPAMITLHPKRLQLIFPVEETIALQSTTSTFLLAHGDSPTRRQKSWGGLHKLDHEKSLALGARTFLGTTVRIGAAATRQLLSTSNDECVVASGFSHGPVIRNPTNQEKSLVSEAFWRPRPAEKSTWLCSLMS